MREKLVIREVVIVEGRYDKITLSQVIDAHIIPTEGFAIFHNKEKQALLKRLERKALKDESGVACK